MKVYVATKAKPFQAEEYICVKATKRQALMSLRELFPYMREIENDIYSSDANNTYLLYIHEEDIQEKG